MAEAIVLAVLSYLAPPVVDLLINAADRYVSNRATLKAEISKEIGRIREAFEPIESLLSYADRWEHDEPVKTWVENVRRVAQEVECILDDHMYDAFSGVRGGAVAVVNHFKYRSTKRKTADLADRLKAISPKVERICNIHDSLVFNTLVRLQAPSARPLQQYNDPDPRRDEREKVRRWIIEEAAGSSRAAAFDAQSSSITVAGKSGQGKTTLVRKIYDDLNQFDCRAWVAVSGITDELELLRALAVQLCEENDPTDADPDDAFPNAAPDELVGKIHMAIKGRRYMIVFDDVMEDDFWDKIKKLFSVDHHRGSRIILTTRSDSVASTSRSSQGRVLRVEPLSGPAAWSLFSSRSFEPPLEHVQPCDNMLMHSYYELPKQLKQCFLYCTMFPVGRLIKRKVLMRLWVAEGFIQEEGQMTVDELAGRYLKELIERGMIMMERQNESERVKACRIHDDYRKVMLEISAAQNFLVVHDENGGSLRISHTRRLSLHNVVSANLRDKDESTRLRSLLLFYNNASISCNPSEYFLSWRYKLLWVLDLSDLPITEVPSWIFEMYNLRYLSLRNTKINVDEFPKEIENLQHLRTLDLWKTEVKSLPRSIIKLKNLEHLMFCSKINPENMKYWNLWWLRGRKAPERIWDMKNLQTLKIIAASDDLVENLKNLVNLRTLSVTNVTTKQCYPLLRSLRAMRHLQRLTLRAKDGDNFLLNVGSSSTHPVPCLQKLQLNGKFSTSPEWLQGLHGSSSTPPFPCLQKLQLNGKFSTSPEWFQWLRHLTHLYLFESRSNDQNLLIKIQSLPKLAMLVLDRAYVWPELSFGPQSFPNLRILCLVNLDATRIVVNRDALPCLRKLYVRSCPKLEKDFRPATWMDSLSALREIVLREHTKELEKYLRQICPPRNVRLTII